MFIILSRKYLRMSFLVCVSVLLGTICAVTGQTDFNSTLTNVTSTKIDCPNWPSVYTYGSTTFENATSSEYNKWVENKFDLSLSLVFRLFKITKFDYQTIFVPKCDTIEFLIYIYPGTSKTRSECSTIRLSVLVAGNKTSIIHIYICIEQLLQYIL